MARPTEFDRLRARDKALVLFWRKGYQASSLNELLEVMDIGRSSFYAAFTDKRSLFVERTQNMLLRNRTGLPPMDALLRFFTQTFTEPRAIRAEWGCMLVNTVLEMSDVDAELAERASCHLETMQQLFQTCLEDAGFAAAPAAEMAALLMLVNEGVRVSSRRGLTLQQQLAPIDTVFRLLKNAIAAPIPAPLPDHSDDT